MCVIWQDSIKFNGILNDAIVYSNAKIESELEFINFTLPNFYLIMRGNDETDNFNDVLVNAINIGCQVTIIIIII